MTIATLLLALAGAAPALADGPYEPNETLDSAAGPIAGGTTVTAARETANDHDWFFFYSSGPRQLDIQIQVSNCSAQPNLSSQSIHFTLRDSSNKIVGEVRDVENGAVSHIRYSTPGRRKFYIATTEDITLCTYTIRIDPADAVTLEPPGHTLGFSGNGTIKASVDGVQVAQITSPDDASFDLGTLAEPQRLTLEVLKPAVRTTSWSFGLTLDELLIFSDSGETSRGATGSIVRRIVLTPTGQVVDSCDADAKEVLDNPADENCDGRVEYRTAVTVKRRGRRYVGKVASVNATCVVARRVRLYREGKRPKLLATTRAKTDGSFRFKRRRSRAKVYVVAPELPTGGVHCQQGRTPRTRS